MKYILSIIRSSRTMVVLLLIFGLGIALATFIENDFGTDAARCLVYNSTWFEVLLALGMLNIIAVVLHTKMYRNGKLSIFVFHIAFIFIILGAGITRYFGSEGNMHIREGQSTALWTSSEPYIALKMSADGKSKQENYRVLFSSISANRFSAKHNFSGRKIKIRAKAYYPLAEQVLDVDQNSQAIAFLVTTGNDGRLNLFLKLNEEVDLNSFSIAFVDENADKTQSDKVFVYVANDGILMFLAPFDVSRTAMADQSTELLKAGVPHPFIPSLLYSFGNVPIVLKQFLPHAKISALPTDGTDKSLPSALVLNCTVDGKARELTLFGKKELTGHFSSIDFKGLNISASYGAIVRRLPFELHLNDFIIKRYPGSESPEWFESNIQLHDPEQADHRQHRIYMNHILKHRGYRFYQSSYDSDEKGTVLSINRDSAGTALTYLGYILMAMGMVISLMNRNSRFVALLRGLASKGPINKLIIVGLILLQTPVFAQGGANNNFKELPVIDKLHAREFGKLLVQDNGGRIEPINTLASEVLRKVSRKNLYNGQSPEQVLLGMMVYPDLWRNEPIIKLGHEGIAKILGVEGKYASFADFFTSDRYEEYSLQKYVEEAYRKKPANRGKFDNEILRTDERLNICYLIYSQMAMKIFPVPNDTNQKWYSPIAAVNVFNNDDSLFVQHILNYYFEEITNSVSNGNWEKPTEMLQALNTFQANYGSSILPVKNRVKAEIFYNNSDIYGRIMRVYLLIGFILLIFQFIKIFIPRLTIRAISLPATIIIVLAFLAHAFALGLRWYVSGHAPWSNGYEALIFIAWGCVLAGLLFSGKLAISISLTSILAALILQTAHLSFMDPQITNLVPVLQSYWLVVHVAVITISYGFLGLGALLAAVNLLLMFFETEKNTKVLEYQISAIASVMEMTLITGLYLLTIGTFLGAVWANESWGRYWAWDPKETWALITVIVYAVILHMRLVPGLKGRVLFNVASLIGFSSVIMTYFGVNYYLSGLHSYAAGDKVPVPPVVLYTVIVVFIISALAAYNQYRVSKWAK